VISGHSIPMWGVEPYESVRRIEVADRNWIKQMGNSVQSGFQIALPICSDVHAFPLWKHTKIDKSVDERGVIARVPFPVDGCAIVPAFPLKTGMGAVLVTPAVCEHCEAWKQVPAHFGKAVVTQEVHDSRRKVGNVNVVVGILVTPVARGKRISSFPRKVKITATLPFSKWNIVFFTHRNVSQMVRIVFNICGCK
jgi:hypothetical protein